MKETVSDDFPNLLRFGKSILFILSTIVVWFTH